MMDSWLVKKQTTSYIHLLCSLYISTALIWGDPHFVTLDNKIYTFNGLGEYTMITIDNVGFELQARTKKTSGRGLGTVFSAAAAKEANTAVVEGRINSQGNLICIAFSLVV